MVLCYGVLANQQIRNTSHLDDPITSSHLVKINKLVYVLIVIDLKRYNYSYNELTQRNSLLNLNNIFGVWDKKNITIRRKCGKRYPPHATLKLFPFYLVEKKHQFV